MAAYALEVSSPLFQLATDALRRHSNARRSLCSFDHLIETCISLWTEMDAIDGAAVRDHLRMMPAEGQIPLHLTLEDNEICPLGRVRDGLHAVLRYELSWAQTVSALLFLFVVERETQSVFAKIRADPTTTVQAGAYPAKIIPFR